MADVPGVLIISGTSGQGGRANGKSVGLTSLADAVGFNTSVRSLADDVDFLRVLPDDQDEGSGLTGAGVSDSMEFWPWYDRAQQQSPAFAVASSPAPTATRVYVDGSSPFVEDALIGRQITVLNDSTQLLIGLEGRYLITDNGTDWVEVASWTGSSTRYTEAGTPVAGQLFVVGTGKFTDYHPMAGWISAQEITNATPSFRGGSSYGQNDRGIGYDAGLLRMLFERVWKASPFFHCAKISNGSAQLVGDLDAAGSSRTAVEDEMVLIESAFTALGSGHTLVWTDIILDYSQEDIGDWGTTPTNALLYKDSVEATIAWLRDSTVCDNVNARVHLISHDPRVRDSASTEFLATIARQSHQVVAREGANIHLVDLFGVRQRTEAQTQRPDANREFYATQEYWTTIPKKMVDSIAGAVLGTTPALEESLPTYILITDSLGVGTMNSTWSTQLDSAVLTNTPRGEKQLIWDDGVKQIAQYDPHDNSNTSGSVSDKAGPEYSLMKELEDRHPEGCLLIKRAAGGSTLATELLPYASGSYGYWLKGVSGQHYEHLERMVPEAFSYARNSLNRQCDLLGVIVMLGTNDANQAVTNGGVNFTNALPGFVANLRTDFQTRSTGMDLPIFWRLPMLGLAGQDGTFGPQIRTALAAYAKTDTRFYLYNVDDALLDSDNLHETPQFAITHGTRIAEAMDAAGV